jgi:hypothetical protein
MIVPCKFCGEEMQRKLHAGKRPSYYCVEDPPRGQSSVEYRYTGHYKVCPKFLRSWAKFNVRDVHV